MPSNGANEDISGRVIPPQRASSSSIPRTIAVPPVRDVPNEQAVEIIWSGYSALAAGGTTFIQLTDPSTGAAFAQSMNPRNRGRLSSLALYCPDMVTDTAPYLFFSMQILGQPANAWNFVPIYPRSGIASIGFPMTTDLPPGATVKIFGKNTDPVNTHFLAVYLYGWYWPKDLKQV